MPNPPQGARPRLIPHWRRELKRLWSMRVAYFWLAVGALVVLWPGLAGAIPAGVYLGAGFVLIFSFGAARLLKQPGAEA